MIYFSASRVRPAGRVLSRWQVAHREPLSSIHRVRVISTPWSRRRSGCCWLCLSCSGQGNLLKVKLFRLLRSGASSAVINRSSYRHGLIINNIITFTFNTLRHPQSVSAGLTQTKMELFCQCQSFVVIYWRVHEKIQILLRVDNIFSSIIFGKADFAKVLMLCLRRLPLAVT